MNQKQRILNRLSDGKWHSTGELASQFVGGVSYNQRINLDFKPKGIEVERRPIKDSHLSEYRLVTPFSMIDIDKCCLKPIEEIIPEHDSKGQYLLPIMGAK